MAINQHANKVMFGSTVLIDLTADTVTEDKILANFTAHDHTGAQVIGKCTFDVDSQDATVEVAEILAGETAYARGVRLTGTMPNREAVTMRISTLDEDLTIAQGYHDGGGKVGILEAERAKLIASNIKQGITILGVTGTLEPSSSVTVHAKTVTPSKTQQIVTPDVGYDYLSQVTVEPISYVETDNSAGGKTITIAG